MKVIKKDPKKEYVKGLFGDESDIEIPEACSFCDGQGYVEQIFNPTAECVMCHGSGFDLTENENSEKSDKVIRYQATMLRKARYLYGQLQKSHREATQLNKDKIQELVIRGKEKGRLD